jgi:uncharacterized repeat protein (TIGR01451 family)
VLAKLRTFRSSPQFVSPFALTVIAAALTLVAASAPAQTITTVAGAGPDTGPATARPIGWPYQVALDAAGNRYIAAGPLHMVVKIDTTGQLSVVAGNGTNDFSGDGGPALNAGVPNPTGVAVDSTGSTVFISDSSMHVVRKVDSVGTITTVAGSPALAGSGGDGGPATSAFINGPGHLALSGTSLYIADTGNHRIRKVNLAALPSPTIVLVAGSSSGYQDGAAASARFNSPNGVAADAGGNVYVADTSNNCVRLVSSGTVSTVAGNCTLGGGFSGDGFPATSAQLNRPEGVAVVAGGTFYIADEMNNRIRRVATGIISTVAGNGSFGFGGDGGAATSAAMNRPYSVAVDSFSNMHLADTFNSRLRVVAGGNINTVGGNGTLRYADGGSALGAVLMEQRNIALNPAGTALFIGDERNWRVRRFDIGAGTISTVAGSGLGGPFNDNLPATNINLAQPWGMAADTVGNLYVADTFNHRIRKVDTGGFLTTVAGTGTQGFNSDGPALSVHLNSPNAVVVDGSGNVYFTDSGNHIVRRLSGGTVTTVAGVPTFSGYDGEGTATGHRLSTPSGIAIDATGNLYVADYGNYRIRKIDTGGTISTVAGIGPPGAFAGDLGPATSAKLNLPRGVAVDSVGNILIADTGNHRVRLVEKRTGRITTVAGTGTAGFSGDGGPATLAKLNQPYSVAVNAQGRVFISDQFNNRIRAMTLAADLSITKTDGQTSEVPGTAVTYTVQVTNAGPTTVTSVNVAESAPATLTGLAFVPSTGTYNPGTGDWMGLSLATGQSATLTVSGTIATTATGSLTNTVTVAPPLGLVDTNAANNQAQDTDTLSPSADVSIGKFGPPSGSVGMAFSYNLNVSNAGPSDATNVVVTDVLPSGVTFLSATAPCTFSAGTVSCALGNLVAGSGVPGITITVIPTQAGTIVNTATVSRFEPDPTASNDSSSTTTIVTNGGPDTVRYLTVTSKTTENILQWLNPVTFGNVTIRYNSSSVACTFPTAADGSDGSSWAADVPGMPNQPGRFSHIGLTDGDQYCYTVWVDKGVAGYSAGQFIDARPFLTAPVGLAGIKWGYKMGIFNMTPPGNGVGVLYAVAQDGTLHSMIKGSGANAGTWPTPAAGFLTTWIPQQMNAPSQGRPSGIPVATQGSTRTIFLSSQDGHVYAFNAETGASGWNIFTLPTLAPVANLQAHPGGVFMAFGGTRNLIFVGTHESTGSKFYALNLADGQVAWTFDGTPFGRIGAISGQAAVDYQAKRVYFASREFDAVANNKTVWCVDFETGLPCAGFAPQAYENIDTAVSLSGSRLFVGSNNAAGTNPRVRAIRASNGVQDWSFAIPMPAEGAPKGYVVTDRLTGDSYFSTATTVWAVDAGGTEKWRLPSLVAPSTPVYAPGDAFVYFGAGDGKLHRIRVAGGEDTTSPFPIRLGDGSAAVGSPTFDLPNYIYVGTENGIVYAVQLP